MAQDKFYYQKQEVKDYANEALEEMTLYVRERYKIPKFKPRMKVDFHPRNYTCHGGHVDGKPVLFIAAYPLLSMVGRKKTRKFLEYDKFKKDPEMGEIKKACWKQWITCAIAHELSHSLQYYAITHSKICKEMLEPYLQTQAEEHGILWQAIYRGLRIRFVNHYEF